MATEPSAPPPASSGAPSALPVRRTQRPHRAAVLEDAVARTVLRFWRRRGWRSRVQPFTGYGTNGWVRVLARVVVAPPGTTAAQDAREAARPALRGWRSYLTVEVPHAVVTVTVGSVTHEVSADRGGYVDAVLPADLPPGRATVRVAAGDAAVAAPVLVLGPEPQVALLSDIDDTVMVTVLPRPLVAAWNALVLHENARRVVPGMAELYRRWGAAHPGAATFYLSTGAWNAAPALERFLARHGYPEGPLLLTDWGPTNAGWFRSGPEHKRTSLDRLMGELPQVRWVLVGDDGQHDPEVYRAAARTHPGRVAAIAIRQLTPAEQLLAHGTPVPESPAPAPGRPAASDPAAPDVPTVHGADGHELTVRLLDADLL